jgi:ribosomal protein L11 methyltransferase
MEYLQAIFTFEKVEEYQKDIFIAELAEIGFDSFEDTDKGLNAYVIKENLNPEKFEVLLAEQDFKFNYQLLAVAAQNWNLEWEKNFNPLTIDNQCHVRATFHPSQNQFAYEIVIDPKMAFGTGHHQTTTLMIRYILTEDFAQNNVLDMGAGTAILAILVAKKGASQLTAIDYDEVCYESAIENAKLNEVDNLLSIHGGKEAIPSQNFDVIFANINRNILLDQMDRYAEVMKPQGRIFFSGFYLEPDLAIIRQAAEEYGLRYESHKELDNWVAAKFIKA